MEQHCRQRKYSIPAPILLFRQIACHLPRQGHSATLLSTGRVLVTGGSNGAGTIFASAELYDPATGKFTTTGSMSNARSRHTATALNNNTVVVIGGVDTGGNVLPAEIYNPASGTFSAPGTLPVGFVDHTATLLTNAQVLVAGGGSFSSSNAGFVFTVV